MIHLPCASRHLVLGWLTLLFLWPMASPALAQQFDPNKEKQAKFLAEQRERFLKALKEAEDEVKKLTAEHGPDHPKTQQAKSKLALSLEWGGKYEQALPLLEEEYARNKDKKTLADFDFEVLTIRLAAVAQRVGKHDRTLTLYEGFLQFTTQKHGEDHATTHNVRRLLGDAYILAKKFDQAEDLYEKVLARHQASKREDTDPVFHAITHLIVVYKESGKAEQAFKLQEELLARIIKLRGKDSFQTANVRAALAEEYTRRKQFDRALAQFQDLVEIYKKHLGPKSDAILIAQNRVAHAYQELGQFDKALPMFEEVLAKFKQLKEPHAQASLLLVMENAANAYEAAKKYKEAEAHRRELLALQRKAAGQDAAATGAALATLGLNLLKQERWSDAEPVLREALAIRQIKEPDDWRTFNAMSMLGGALLGQKKHREAEPLLTQGYEGMHKRSEQIPPLGKVRLTEAIERLVRLYEATERPKEAALRKILEDTKKLMP